jgi:class 3 adenylate cyclase
MTAPASRQHFFHDMTFREADLSEVRAQRGERVLRWALWMAAGSAVVFALLFALTGNLRTAGIELAVVAVLGGLIAAQARGHGTAVAHATFWLMGGFVLAINIFEGLGPQRHHNLHVWFLALAVGAFLIIPAPRWLSLAYSFAAICAFSVLEMGLVTLAPQMPISREAGAIASVLSLGLAMALIFVCLVIFHGDMGRAEERLNRANARLEDLLGNMLPAPIAERLRTEGRTFADAYAECTIVFADIVGFSQLAASLPPVDLVQTLDTLFSRFDALVDELGLEKIKTIGDAYMVASGIPHARPDHAIAAVELALRMQAAVADHPGIAVRIGINSGPVVAGVIGRKRFIYDLWGDAVNIAQRMEQSGLPGAIQITESTWTRVRERFETEARGRVAIKGGGELAAYLVKARKPT